MGEAPRARSSMGWTTVAMLAAVLAIVGCLLTGSLGLYFDAVVIAAIGFGVMTWIGVKMAKPVDAAWLPAMVAAGYLAKIAVSITRYGVLQELYGGKGDAAGYHGAANQLVHVWRSFNVPDMSIGTEFFEALTGLIYVPRVPTMIGGFFIFATLAFIGQLLMYAAFRRSRQPRRLKWYAAAIFFIPAIIYWPASIGKESIMFLGIGLAVYGIARLFDGAGFVSILSLGAGLALAGAVRPHISALIVVSAAVALLFAKGGPGLTLRPLTRIALIVVIVATAAVVVVLAAREFNIDLEADLSGEVDEFVGTVEDNTSKGGSEVSGGFVRSIQDVPEAALRVLFRPLIYEAHNIQALASGLESTILLLIVLWRSPWLVRNIWRVRRDAYVLFCLVFTIGFVLAFSPFLNLGLMARERSQILPFLAVVVIQLGWNWPEKPATEAVGTAESAAATA